MAYDLPKTAPVVKVQQRFQVFVEIQIPRVNLKMSQVSSDSE